MAIADAIKSVSYGPDEVINGLIVNNIYTYT